MSAPDVVTVLPSLHLDDFPAFFDEVWGFGAPFPWQIDLLRQVHEERRWPELIDLPTGAGKTSVLDLAVFLQALEADQSATERWMPRRIVLVVDRRVIVDQAAEHGSRILDALAGQGSEASRAVAARLRALSGGGPPLVAGVLRGGIERNDTWAERPDVPALLSSTVDQVGSRLLFRGYGVSRRMRPVHAGLLANDCLFLLDEVHLAQPFAQTLRQLEPYRALRSEEVPDRWHVAELSATPGDGGRRRFPEVAIDPGSHPVLRRRLIAPKPARLEPVKVARDPAQATLDLAAACAKHARELVDRRGATTIGVVVNRVATAREAAVQLSGRTDVDVVLLTGRMRPLDRDRVLDQELLERLRTGRERRDGDRPLVVVATQSIEAGADFDFDGLVTECASLDALRQRFGRVDRDGRLGERGTPASSVILMASTQVAAAEPDPVYGTAMRATWAWLNGLTNVDFGIRNLAEPEEPQRLATPRPDAPILLPSHLDQLARTSHAVSADPSVERWLHGSDQDAEVADVQVVWRSDISTSLLAHISAGVADAERGLSDRIAACPPLSGEMLSLPISAVRRWLSDDAAQELADVTKPLPVDDDRPRSGRSAVRWRAGAASVVEPRSLRPGDVVVVPTTYGGIWCGNWSPGSDDAVVDLAEEATLVRRGRAVLRLRCADTPAVSDGAVHCSPLPEDLETEPLAARRTIIREHLRQLLDAPGTAPARRALIQALVADRRMRLVVAPELVDAGEVRSSYVAVSSRQISRSDIGADDRGDAPSFTGVPDVRLDDHLRGVEGWARRLAERLGVPAHLVDDLALAGRLHDLGKADRRFQDWLYGGKLASAGRPMLAKSATPDTDRRARTAARSASGYPPGARHEALSVALVEGASVLDAASDPELVLHLVATHHGFGRYRFDPVVDLEPVPVEVGVDGTGLSASSDHAAMRLDAASVQRFFDLQIQYGWFGLVWLETVLRLADQQRSREEQRGLAGEEMSDG